MTDPAALPAALPAFVAADEAAAAALPDLWARCGLTRPWNDPARDIAFARAQPNADLLVARDGAAMIASVMVGQDGHRGVVYYLAVDPDRQGRGLGRAAMAAAEAWLAARGVWKLNLLVRADNAAVVDFYRALGYAAEDRVVLSRRLSD